MHVTPMPTPSQLGKEPVPTTLTPSPPTRRTMQVEQVEGLVRKKTTPLLPSSHIIVKRISCGITFLHCCKYLEYSVWCYCCLFFHLQAILQAVVHGYYSPSPSDVFAADVELGGGTGNGSGYNRTAMPTEFATMTDFQQAVTEANESCHRNVLSKPYPNDGTYTHFTNALLKCFGLRVMV